MKIPIMLSFSTLLFPLLSLAANPDKQKADKFSYYQGLSNEDQSIEDTESFSENSNEDEIDNLALKELLKLCLDWMDRNKHWDFQTAKMFMATFVTTEGRDYPYIYTLEALRQGANPHILDTQGRTASMIARERNKANVYNLIIIMGL